MDCPRIVSLYILKRLEEYKFRPMLQHIISLTLVVLVYNLENKLRKYLHLLFNHYLQDNIGNIREK
ncbi:hypothetical protein V1477_004846 [Vespula maculifrons]|uniref:Uncharacterized protein n=1 Tax=Vespula maculifrons TaxID=7453 RepID=A0ABD2CN82_VESMC